MKDFLNNCPESLVKDIANYIYDAQETEQPAIALASALSFVGSLLSGRVHYETDSHITTPCLYTAIIADTGSGKTSAENIIKDIAVKANLHTDMSKFLMGKPASDSALLIELSKSARRWLSWDEFGIALQTLSQNKTGCQAEILSTLMSLYSSNGKKLYLGKSYATKDSLEIKEPLLSVFAASTSVRFMKALTKDFVSDGFLPRWLLFFEDTKYKEKTPNKDSKKLDNIIDRVKVLNKWQSSNSGNLSALEESPRKNINVKIKIKETSDIFNIFDYWKDEIKDIRKEAKNESYQKLFYTRALEQTYRLCLCFSESGECPEASTSYVINLVRELLNSACEKCNSNIFENDKHRARNDLFDKLTNFAKIGETFSRTQLWSKSRNWQFTSQEKNAAISELLESEIWEKVQQESDPYAVKKCRPITIYRRLR